MKQYLNRTVTAIAIVLMGVALSLPTQAALKVPSAGGAKSEAGTADIDGFKKTADQTLQNVSATYVLLGEAEARFSAALVGKTKGVEKLQAAIAALQANKSTKVKDIEKLQKDVKAASDAAREESAKQLGESKELSHEAKTNFTAGLEFYAGGVASETALVTTVVELAKQASDIAQKAPPAEKPQVMGYAKTIGALASSMPEDLKKLGSTTKGLLDFCKKQNITPSDNVKSKLGGL